MRGCVLAGVWGAGKTSTYERSIARLIAGGCQSVIAVPQAATITTHIYTPGSTADHVTGIQSWLDDLTSFLEGLDSRFQASTLPNHRFAHSWTPTCLLEGLGFDLPVYELPVPRYAVLDVEHRLTAIGLGLVVLRVPDQRLQAQCIESTRIHRGPRWTKFLDGFGSDDLARTQHVQRAQDRLMRWAQTSPMRLHVIDTTTSNWDDYARQVTDLIISAPRATHDRHPPNAPTPAAAAHSPCASADP